MFCLAQVGTIQGTVFKDSNENAAKDTFEPVQSGWTVTLRSGSTVIGTRVTDASGAYTFGDQALGTTYTVCETAPAASGDWGQTTPAANAYCPSPLTTGHQFMLDTAIRVADFGIVPVVTAPCDETVGPAVYQFNRNCVSAQPTKTFVVSTWVDASGKQFVNLHPAGSGWRGRATRREDLVALHGVAARTP